MLITIKDFDEQFSHNYKYFQSYVKVVSGNNYNRFEHNVCDLVNDVYCDIKDRVMLSAVTATTVISYIKQSLRNALYYQIRPDLKKNKIKFVDCTDMVYEEKVEGIMQDIHDTQISTDNYKDVSQQVSRLIFKFLEHRYDEKEMFIFKTYFLMKKRMTYKKLSKATGFSITQCSITIKSMKTDIKENFQIWLKNKKSTNY